MYPFCTNNWIIHLYMIYLLCINCITLFNITSLISLISYLDVILCYFYVIQRLLSVLCCEHVNFPSGINKVLSCLMLSNLTLVVVLLSGLQGSCAATAVDPWVAPDDPWPWAWPWESLLWEMDSFFFRGRPFRLGAEGEETRITV